MPQERINPWRRQHQYGFSQAIEVSAASRLVFCAGQIALDADGKVQCPGDMRGQIEAAMNNVETVLAAAGLSVSHVIRLNFYTTEVDQLFPLYDVIGSRLASAGCQPSSTLLGSIDWHFPNCSLKSKRRRPHRLRS